MCTPTGYNLLDHSRAGRRGGGTGIMFRDNLSVCQCTAGEFQSFEYSEWKITSGTQRIHMIIIYRPPYSEAHPTTTCVFLGEFSRQYLESAVLYTDQLLISGDFNIHVDGTDDSDARRFRGLLDSMGLDQHVKVSTHISGHTLDLIITRNSDQLLVSAPWADHLFSDHMPVHCNILVEKPSFKKSQISYRKLKSINMEALRNDLSKSDLCNNTLSLELNDLVSCYNETLTSTLDRHAPLITKSVTKRPVVPWFSQELKLAKKERRHAERKWRRTKLDCDFRIYKAKKNRATFEMKKARKEYYTSFIQENSYDPRKLFRSAKTLFNHEKELHFQGHPDNMTLADDIGNFFVQKVNAIRARLDAATPSVDTTDDGKMVVQMLLVLTEEEVSTLITKSSKKSCSQDPMPTHLVVECLDVLLPVLTRMINLSLESSCFPDSWKHAVVHPRLKKPKAEVIFVFQISAL